MKYFLSGTYRNLVADREAARGELARLGQVVTMEHFRAQGYPALDVCLGELSECNVMVLLFGDSYGTVVDAQDVSYTEAEFNSALARGILVLAFLKVSSDAEPRWINGETDAGRREKLERFKDRVGRAVTWVEYSDPADLPFHIQRAVSAAERVHGRLDVRGRNIVRTDRYFPRLAETGRSFHHARALVGRADTIVALLAAVGKREKLITVVGGRGGIGKTRLLIEAARRARNAGIECPVAPYGCRDRSGHAK